MINFELVNADWVKDCYSKKQSAEAATQGAL